MGRRSRIRRHRARKAPEPPPVPFPTPESYLGDPDPTCRRCGVPGPTVQSWPDPFWEVYPDLLFWLVLWCDGCIYERRMDL